MSLEQGVHHCLVGQVRERQACKEARKKLAPALRTFSSWSTTFAFSSSPAAAARLKLLQEVPQRLTVCTWNKSSGSPRNTMLAKQVKELQQAGTGANRDTG